MNSTLDQLLQKSNEHASRIQQLADLSEEELKRKPKEKSWCALEVVDHLNKVYDIYIPNFQKALSEVPLLGDDEEVKYAHSLLGRMAIFSSKPKGNKRRFKIKTFDFFEPSLISKDETIEVFFQNKQSFNELLKEARAKNVSKVKMPTALGEKYKLYIPECFAFVLAHEERHLVQISGLIS